MTDATKDASDASEALRRAVREKYAAAARAASEGRTATCGPADQAADPGAGSCCGDGGSARRDPVTADLYGEEEAGEVPGAALEASLGCGNPTALARLREGEAVLDLGSGGGVDVLLSARRVGPSGHAYGVDMTDEMLELARGNAREAGVENVTFLKGEIEALPLPDASVDVVISNCVINLSGDKPRVLAEAHRVLKPGGRLAVSDVVVRGSVAPEVRRSLELWTGCVAGALEQDEYRRLLREAGFVDVDVEPTRVYDAEDARGFLEEAGLDPDRVAPQMEGRIMAAFVRARKPAPV